MQGPKRWGGGENQRNCEIVKGGGSKNNRREKWGDKHK